jgi:hypothetical protein
MGDAVDRVRLVRCRHAREAQVEKAYRPSTMRAYRLIFAGVACLALAGAITIPGERPLKHRPVETHAVHEARVYLSTRDSMRASSAGLLPQGTASILAVRTKLKHGDFRWDEDGVPPGKVRAFVNLRTQMISVFRGRHEIGTAVVLFGAEDKNTPVGTFPILTKIEDHRSSTYDAPMPFTMRLTDDGVAVHGSDVRLGAGTHGCIGVPLEFARLMFEQVRVADEVEIVA